MQAATQTNYQGQRNAIPVQQVEKRDELLLMATRRFCGLDAYDRLGIDQYTEAFYGLIGHASSKLKFEIASLLSTNKFTPRAIMYYLACESIDIAAPIIRSSPVPSQLDLLQIIENCSIEHSRVISKRPDLGPALVRHLNRKNDPEIAACLIENGAIKPAKSVVVKKYQANAVVEPIETAKAKKVSYTITRNQPSTNNHKSVREAAAFDRQSGTDKLIEAASRGGRLATKQAAKSPERTAHKQEIKTAATFESAMLGASLKSSRPAMAVLIQKQFNLTLETCHQLFEDKSGDTFSVLLKAAGVDKSAANRILLLSFPSIGLSVQNAHRAVKFYDKLNQQSCIEAVDKWPKAPSTSSAVHKTAFSDDSHQLRRAGGEYDLQSNAFGDNRGVELSQTG